LARSAASSASAAAVGEISVKMPPVLKIRTPSCPKSASQSKSPGASSRAAVWAR
jgi:hypothetical protein